MGLNFKKKMIRKLTPSRSLLKIDTRSRHFVNGASNFDDWIKLRNDRAGHISMGDLPFIGNFSSREILAKLTL